MIKKRKRLVLQQKKGWIKRISFKISRGNLFFMTFFGEATLNRTCNAVKGPFTQCVWAQPFSFFLFSSLFFSLILYFWINYNFENFIWTLTPSEVFCSQHSDAKTWNRILKRKIAAFVWGKKKCLDRVYALRWCLPKKLMCVWQWAYQGFWFVLMHLQLDSNIISSNYFAPSRILLHRAASQSLLCLTRGRVNTQTIDREADRRSWL